MSSSMYGKRPSAMVACSRNRRRRTVPDLAAVTSDSSSWACLHEDLVRLIGWRVLAGDLLDYVRFRAVCPHWRSNTVCPRGHGVVDPRFHPRRWMMLPEGPGHGKLRGYVRFLNLATGVFVRVRLPLFRDHCILDSVDGLLLLQRDRDTVIRLLHPFTGDIAELPPLATLLTLVPPSLAGAHEDVGKWEFLRSVSATSINVSADGVITVMIALCRMVCVAFATSRDQRWRLSRWRLSFSCQPMSFQGKIYMLHDPTFSGEGHVFQIDPPQHEGMGSGSSSLLPPKLIATCPAGKLHRPWYLAECDSEILVIGLSDSHFSHFLVYRLSDLILEKTVPVTLIGGNALFIGHRTLCVNSKGLPTIVGDTIVCMHRKKSYLAEYHLSSGTWSPAADGFLRSGVVPSPCSIEHHIFTSCCRVKWNKGLTCFQEPKISWRVKGKWRIGA